LISNKLYTATLIITIIPPKNVSCEIVSLKNIQTQNGPSENSKNIKNVTSEARRNQVAKIHTKLAHPVNTPPHKKHSKKS